MAAIMSEEVRELLKKAKGSYFSKGDAYAQFALGWKFEKGYGVAKDEKQAAEWYRRAAEQGHVTAQTALGIALSDGRGVAKDLRQAVVWFRKAAEQGHARAQYYLGWCFEKGEGVAKDLRQAVVWFRKAAEQGDAFAKRELERLNSTSLTPSALTTSMQSASPLTSSLGTESDKVERKEKYETKLIQEQEDITKTSDPIPGPSAPRLESLAVVSDAPVSSSVSKEISSPLASPLKVDPDAKEHKDKQEFKLTREQQEVIEALGNAGLGLKVEQLKKDFRLISIEECRAFSSWKESVSSHLSMLQQGLLETHQELGLDSETKARCELIESRPKLLAYRRRLEKEFGYFALCYSLAPAGLLQLKENKKDMMIAAISSIPQATIEGIPLVGPLVGKLFGLIPKGLKLANKKHRMQQVNQIKELFGGLREIIKIAYLLSIELTLAKQSEIEAYEKTQYEGFAKIKGLYQLGKSIVMQQWHDLVTSDITGVKLKPAEELAILDCAFIMQQVSAEEVHLDATRALVPQLVEAVIGKAYKPIVVALPVPVTTPVSPLSLSVSPPVTPMVSPTSRISPASLSELESLRQLVREQQETAKQHEERQRKLEEALEAERTERKALAEQAEAARTETTVLAEKLAKVQKQLQPTEVDGGAESLSFIKPEVAGSASTFVSYAEFHALKQQMTQVTQTTIETKEQIEAVSVTVYNLQDGKKTDRSKAGVTHITHVRDFALLEAERKMKEETARAAERAKAKEVITTQDLM